ncbi:MAG: class I tRNA ligase family protein, partial [Patescibacteria group bacterium]
MATNDGQEKLTKPYNPQETEGRIYGLWEKSGYFNPDKLPADKTPMESGLNADENQRESASYPRKSAFSIIMPPPNANGHLHAGHALFITLEDIMTR